jgi:hypothetical protein
MDRPPLESIDTPLRNALRHLGLGEVEVLLRLLREWDSMAGPPWSGASEPVKLQAGELVVRAERSSSVRVLRYATGSLIERLDTQLGEGVVTSVRVVAPGS